MDATTTAQRNDGTWSATVAETTCDHKHSNEKAARGCGDWQAIGLAKSEDRWTARATGADRKPRARKQFASFAPTTDDGERASDDDIATSHEYVPAKELIELWHAVTSAATIRPAANLMFLGPSGSGKTDGARYLAGLVGLDFMKVDAASMTDPEAWFGTRELVVEDGVAVTKYAPSSFAIAITKPGLILIDEISRVRDEHRNVILPVLDGTRQVMNPLTSEILVRHPQCFVVMAGNVGIAFTGTNAIDPAFMTRAITVEFDYLAETDEQRVVVDASGCTTDDAYVFVRLANETRAKSAIDPEFLPVSTREIIEMGRLTERGLSRDLAVKFVVLNAASAEGGTASVRQELQSIWNGVRASRPVAGGSTVTADWNCPEHGGHKVIPAGVSSKTGRSYTSFRGCPIFGCENTSDRTKAVQPVNGTILCPDCNDPQPVGRSICVNCGASLQ